MKYNPEQLITYRDRLLQLICRIHDINNLQDDINLQYELTVHSNNERYVRFFGKYSEIIWNHFSRRLDFITSEPTKPAFSLQILDRNQQRIDKINAGEPGYVEIDLTPSTQKGWLQNYVNLLIESKI